LNLEELHLIALGSVLAGWGPFGKDIEAAAGFSLHCGTACNELGKGMIIT